MFIGPTQASDPNSTIDTGQQGQQQTTTVTTWLQPQTQPVPGANGGAPALSAGTPAPTTTGVTPKLDLRQRLQTRVALNATTEQFRDESKRMGATAGSTVGAESPDRKHELQRRLLTRLAIRGEPVPSQVPDGTVGGIGPSMKRKHDEALVEPGDALLASGDGQPQATQQPTQESKRAAAHDDLLRYLAGDLLGQNELTQLLRADVGPRHETDSPVAWSPSTTDVLDREDASPLFSDREFAQMLDQEHEDLPPASPSQR